MHKIKLHFKSKNKKPYKLGECQENIATESRTNNSRSFRIRYGEQKETMAQYHRSLSQVKWPIFQA